MTGEAALSLSGEPVLSLRTSSATGVAVLLGELRRGALAPERLPVVLSLNVRGLELASVPALQAAAGGLRGTGFLSLKIEGTLERSRDRLRLARLHLRSGGTLDATGQVALGPDLQPRSFGLDAEARRFRAAEDFV